MVLVVEFILPDKKILPHCPDKVFQSPSDVVVSLDFPYCNLIKPPALKKYLASAAEPNVTVWVKVMVQADCPDPVAEVLLVVPLKVPTSVPDAAALPREPVSVFRSVVMSLKIAMVLPVTGAVRAVIEVP